MQEIDTLVETIKIIQEDEIVNVYDFDEHALRLLNSASELGFTLAGNNINFKEQILWLKNLVKNELQYGFKSQVIFCHHEEPEGRRGDLLLKQEIATPAFTSLRQARNDTYKLRILLHKNSKIEIFIEPYTRDLNKSWKARLLSKEEFYINSQDPKFKYKFYPRLDFSKYLESNSNYDEVIWTNEKDEICEGSFTNIFFEDVHGNWHTPYLAANILSGIMRSKLIKELNAKEKSIKRDELKNFKKIFLANSIIEFKEIIF